MENCSSGLLEPSQSLRKEEINGVLETWFRCVQTSPSIISNSCRIFCILFFFQLGFTFALCVYHLAVNSTRRVWAWAGEESDCIENLPLWDIWKCLEAFLVIKTRGVLLASSGILWIDNSDVAKHLTVYSTALPPPPQQGINGLPQGQQSKQREIIFSWHYCMLQ